MIKVRLSVLLGEKRISQAELARRAGIRPNTINELYHDFAKRVSLEELNSICNVLGCELIDLLEYTPDIKKKNKEEN